MNIDDLKCFEAVYREGSIHKAAKHLFITPQGLGKNIRNLENELGTLLFLRSKKVWSQHKAPISYISGPERLWR